MGETLGEEFEEVEESEFVNVPFGNGSGRDPLELLFISQLLLKVSK